MPPPGERSVLVIIEILRVGGALAGWARRSAPDSGTSDRPLELEIVLDGVPIQRFTTGQPRPDLGAALGFTTRFLEPVRLLDFCTGRVTFELPDRDPSIPVTVQFTGEARALLLDAVAERLTTTFGSDVGAELAGALRHVESRATRSKEAGSVAGRSDAAEQVEQTLRDLGLDWRTTEQTSLIPLPLGYVSADGSVMVGHEGQLLLVGGSNGVLEQALQPLGPDVRTLVAGWADLFEQRAIQCAQWRQRFVQIVIPEKQTVLRSACPAAIPTPTAVAAQLDAAVYTRPHAVAAYLNLLPVLQQVAQRELPFPRTDSHLTPGANYACFAAILNKMGLESPFDPTFSATGSIVGDLSERLLGMPLREAVWAHSGSLAAESAAPRLKTAMDPTDGGHIGSHYSWESPQAPLDACVVCFGNSFFERGAPRGLSYWFARAFREFHFIWTPELDAEYAASIGASHVLGQTIERYLVSLPSR